MDLTRVLTAVARRLEPAVGRVLRIGRLRRFLHGRALRAWQATEAPLIVCYGNINRSPFAAGLARARPASRARSAGFHPESGRCSPPPTISLAAARGVDLTAHRSVVLRGDMVDAAPAIFLFDLENLVRLAMRTPSALMRTHFLGTLAETGNALIIDPHGRDSHVLEDVMTQLEHAIHSADRSRSESP
jgi:protein-tyrosine-phosphatase